MSQKKKRKNAGSSGKEPRRSKKWTMWDYSLVALIVIVFAVVVAYKFKAELAPATAGSEARDKYGRSPGHAHYNHAHP